MSTNHDFLETYSETAQQTADYLRRAPVPGVPPAERAAACRLAASCARPRSLARRESWRVLCACLALSAAPFSMLCACVLAGMVVLSRQMAPQSGLPLTCVTVLAPVPVLSFAIRDLHYRDPALAQLEKTCRYSPEKLWFARLWASTLGSALCVGGAACLLGQPEAVEMLWTASLALLSGALAASLSLFVLAAVCSAAKRYHGRA